MNNPMMGLLVLAGLCWSAHAAVLPPQKLLPKDTLLVVTAPDGARAWSALSNTPLARFWSDPAMRPFRDKFDNQLTNQFIAPLERAFGLKLADYKELIQGQVTFALVPGNPADQSDPPLARLLLLDTKDRAEQLKKDLAEFKKKWTDAGKPIKTQTLRRTEFTTFLASSEDLPWRPLVPAPQNPLADDPAQLQAKPPGQKTQWTVGQDDSLLLVSDSAQAIEKILGRQQGASIPALDDLPAFQKDFSARLQDARIYAWVNTAGMLDYWLAKPAAIGNDPNSAEPGGLSAMFSSVGLNGLTSGSFVYRDGSEGTTLQFFADLPQDSRRGVLKALVFDPKDSSPPPFVPADAVKFFRLRLDIPRTWAVLETTLGEINPMAAKTINWILQTAGKDKDENYDLKAQLLSNLGSDIISYQRSPRENTLAALKSPPSIYLIGSPNADKLAVALKVALGALVQGTGNIKDREFLGRKIYSAQMPAAQGGTSPFNFAAGGDYLAMSSDAGLLEEYLRSGENRPTGLGQMAGLNDAAQKVGGMANGLFGFSNEKENMRAVVETYRKTSVSWADLLGPAPMLGKAASEDTIKLEDWADFSLLPSFDTISKYFYYSIYAGNFTPEGFSLTFFTPVPPQLH